MRSKLLLKSAEFYKDDCCVQITDYIYLGNIRSASNEHLLCKLKIGSILDLSNADTWAPDAHSLRACSCTLQTAHPRCRLNIGFTDGDGGSMTQFFVKMSKFIDAACERKYGVIVCSHDAVSRAPCAVIQYLMSRQRMSLSQAYDRVMRRWPAVRIHDSLWRSLEDWEKKLYGGETATTTFRRSIADDWA
ncbi:PREDICTED: dual specificity protein phosphatase 14-like [Priapulus caudatus]|uniref:protein-tyrosine-phosphatase n=1 Tax=Priapulus caudatus TaxID=37621 RepID=A0ABM1ES43_PRICU|nr:PREDICTED: dual specificity protein phosphatase 14-like [Priapulus caudatus]